MMNKCVLCIEDNGLNMKLIRSILALDRIVLLEAPDAETGLEILRSNKPDLILMDIQLPGMDGYSATRLIKQDPALRNIPVIALTAFAMAGDEAKAYEAGAEAYVTKPINAKQFREIIKKFLSIGTSEEPAKTDPASSFRPKIMIVDDNRVNIKLLEAMLAADRFRITRAYSGQEALTRAAEDAPDLILLDVMMPDLDGYDVARRLKQDPRTADIPVILVTALDGSENRASGFEAGAEEFITKPVNAVELLARVNSLLRLKQYRNALTRQSESEQAFDDLESFVKTPGETAPDHPMILLVEDDPAAAELVKSYLQDESYRLEIVGNGTDALAFAQTVPIDAAILDILLPDINGFDICCRIKASEKNKDVPVIMMTCLNDIESRVKGIEMGCDAFLVKPIFRRELIARVRALIDKKKQVDALRSSYSTSLSSAALDWLTGLFNRRYADWHLGLEIKRSIRHGHSVGLIMIDIDDFKKHNDLFGHEAGDKILKDTAFIVKNMIREIDLAARFGGDEFLVILPYTDSPGAIQVAQRIQRAVMEHKFPLAINGASAKLSLSMGIVLCPADGSNKETLIRQADSLLYLAKRQGKGRLCIDERTFIAPLSSS